MNERHAKVILWHTKRAIGNLLTQFRLKPDQPACALAAAREQLGANQAQLHSIYKKFPGLKPDRVEQLKLDI